MSKLFKLSVLACCGMMLVAGCDKPTAEEQKPTAEEQEMESIYSQVGASAETIKADMEAFRQLPVEEQKKELEKARTFLPKAK